MANDKRILTTHQYAKEIHYKYTKKGTSSQQYVHRLLVKGELLPEVKNVIRSGKYFLLEII